MVLLLPNRSESRPALMAPKAAPNRSVEVTSPSVNGVRPRSRFLRIGWLGGARALGLDRGGVRYGLLRVGPHYLTLSMYRPIVSSW
ncbi:hypothetical protein QFZ79_000846 [Arthrobacter sp. V4I6]|nr:hypothetical protein [Arthrobacter sp. V1I7]MDQ0852735.1 hypothetical protein [Arthrobacter sp. V4I6]